MTHSPSSIRLRASASWETADSGQGEGARTAQFLGAEGRNYFLRIVARDRHGNTRTSASWRFSVPLDDANALFASAYGGTWTTTASGDPFLGTLHSSSTAGSSFTHTFTVTHSDTRIVWIGPSSPNGGGQATVTLDGGPPVFVDQSGVTGDRTIVWEGSDPSLGPHALRCRRLVERSIPGIENASPEQLIRADGVGACPLREKREELLRQIEEGHDGIDVTGEELLAILDMLQSEFGIETMLWGEEARRISIDEARERTRRLYVEG